MLSLDSNKTAADSVAKIIISVFLKLKIVWKQIELKLLFILYKEFVPDSYQVSSFSPRSSVAVLTQRCQIYIITVQVLR